MVGVQTTCGSRVLAESRPVATADAACLAAIRAEEKAGRLVIVGRTNLHELAFGVSGVNPWFGTPTNPVDPGRVPGGSSSGSAVAVATGDADVALGTDTGGSIRIPAACCGVVGLKTTRGRISLTGVDPLGPSLDTVGPMAATVEATARGMCLLEPTFTWRDHRPARRVARFRPPADRGIDQAIDERLAAWAAAAPGREVTDVALGGFDAATEALAVILAREAWLVRADLWSAHAGELSPDVAARLQSGAQVSDEAHARARTVGHHWADELSEVLRSFDVVALPVLASEPPRLEDAARVASIRYTGPFNLFGGPALALPVGRPEDRFPASLQLVGAHDSEALLLSTARTLEEVAPQSPVRPSGREP